MTFREPRDRLSIILLGTLLLSAYVVLSNVRKIQMKKTSLVIMAAGIGSRFGGGIKQLEPVGP